MILRGSTVAAEVAHRGADGVLHGHSLTIEAWTDRPVDLDAWKAEMRTAVSGIEGQLEATIGGRTFEAVAERVLRLLPGCVRVVVRLPTRGHAVEMSAADLVG